MSDSSNFDATTLLWVLLSGSILLNLILAFRKKPNATAQIPSPEPASSPLAAELSPSQEVPEFHSESESQQTLPAQSSQAAPEQTQATLESESEPQPLPPADSLILPAYREDPHPAETLNLSENEERFVSRLANQVAHDIRSPLAHLLAVAAMDDRSTLDEHVREGIRDSANRIREIARQISSAEGLDSLLQRSAKWAPTEDEAPTPQNQTPRVTQSGEIEDLAAPISAAPAKLETVVAPASTQRVRKPRPTPTQKFEDELPEVQLLEPILETLSTKVQDRIGRLAKVRWWNGNGFGIFVNLPRRKFVSEFLKAVDTFKEAGTTPITIEVNQAEGKSLEIRVISPEGGEFKPLRLTLSSAPGWFADQILLPKDCNLIILDDDPSIHRLWAQRLKNLPCNPVHLRDHESAVDWYRNNWVEGQNTFWLCDHELGMDSRTGLETIELLGVQDEALLVTSRFEDPEVQARVIRQGVRILPKLLAPIAPIEWAETLANS